MNKTFKELGFKAGDRVRCVRSAKNFRPYRAGDEFILTEQCGELSTYDQGFIGGGGDWELIERKRGKEVEGFRNFPKFYYEPEEDGAQWVVIIPKNNSRDIAHAYVLGPYLLRADAQYLADTHHGKVQRWYIHGSAESYGKQE